jgi:hypothetical protein
VVRENGDRHVLLPVRHFFHFLLHLPSDALFGAKNALEDHEGGSQSHGGIFAFGNSGGDIDGHYLPFLLAILEHHHGRRIRTIDVQKHRYGYHHHHNLCGGVGSLLPVHGVESFITSCRTIGERKRRGSVSDPYESNQSAFPINSLNALSALVHSDPDKAEEFIDEFAKIYRYVLEVKEQNVVSLKAELGFLDSFMFLQKIRFGDNLKLEKTVPAAMMEYFLPPLALQELIENAIKHNEVSGQRPLTISVQVIDDVLMVANPLQPRKELVQSTGTGLTNLKARYNLFGNKVPAFVEEDSQFIARLPLIEGE